MLLNRRVLSIFLYSAPTLVGALCIFLIMTGTLVSACDLGGSNSEGEPEVLVSLEEGNEGRGDVGGI